jgi:hypothetical protein
MTAVFMPGLVKSGLAGFNIGTEKLIITNDEVAYKGMINCRAY